MTLKNGHTYGKYYSFKEVSILFSKGQAHTQTHAFLLCTFYGFDGFPLKFRNTSHFPKTLNEKECISCIESNFIKVLLFIVC